MIVIVSANLSTADMQEPKKHNLKTLHHWLCALQQAFLECWDNPVQCGSLSARYHAIERTLSRKYKLTPPRGMAYQGLMSRLDWYKSTLSELLYA